MPACNDVSGLDPYAFLALIEKKILHPGGLPSTEQMIRLIDFSQAQQVLDIGCGIGSTTIRIALRFRCPVMALDIDKSMLDRARANVRNAGLEGRIVFEQGDMRALPFTDESFEVVTIEAVTLFTGDQLRSAGEAVRVCKRGGTIPDHELVWLEPSHEKLRALFRQEICPGAEFGMR